MPSFADSDLTFISEVGLTAEQAAVHNQLLKKEREHQLKFLIPVKYFHHSPIEVKFVGGFPTSLSYNGTSLGPALFEVPYARRYPIYRIAQFDQFRMQVKDFILEVENVNDGCFGVNIARVGKTNFC